VKRVGKKNFKGLNTWRKAKKSKTIDILASDEKRRVYEDGRERQGKEIRKRLINPPDVSKVKKEGAPEGGRTVKTRRLKI